jgi:hypothetical protein
MFDEIESANIRWYLLSSFFYFFLKKKQQHQRKKAMENNSATTGSKINPIVISKEETSLDNVVENLDPMENHARLLLKNGIAVIPHLSLDQVNTTRKEYLAGFLEFREYKKHEEFTPYVKGGFGAFGNPSSFHAPFVREVRKNIMPLAILLFKQLEKLRGTERNIEQLFDRVCFRLFGSSVNPESFHRDVSTGGDPENDDIYGGWINLDTKDQKFSCVTGTHTDPVTQTGFATFPDPKEAKKKYSPLKTEFIIPPGSWIVFNQRIVHEIKKNQQKSNSLKQFVGWRLTTSMKPLFDAMDAIENQGVPLLPSGQKPPMYAKSNLSYQFKETIEWSKIFKKCCTETKTHKRTKEKYSVVKRNIPSLVDLNLELYPSYKISEVCIMTPQPLFPRKLVHPTRKDDQGNPVDRHTYFKRKAIETSTVSSTDERPTKKSKFFL